MKILYLFLMWKEVIKYGIANVVQMQLSYTCQKIHCNKLIVT